MRYLILFLLFIGCVTTQTPSICMCPKENVIIHGQVDEGFIFLQIPQGSLDDPETYWTEDEFTEDMEKALKGGDPL